MQGTVTLTNTNVSCKLKAGRLLPDDSASNASSIKCSSAKGLLSSLSVSTCSCDHTRLIDFVLTIRKKKRIPVQLLTDWFDQDHLSVYDTTVYLVKMPTVLYTGEKYKLEPSMVPHWCRLRPATFSVSLAIRATWDLWEGYYSSAPVLPWSDGSGSACGPAVFWEQPGQSFPVLLVPAFSAFLSHPALPLSPVCASHNVHAPQHASQNADQIPGIRCMAFHSSWAWTELCRVYCLSGPWTLAADAALAVLPEPSKVEWQIVRSFQTIV